MRTIITVFLLAVGLLVTGCFEHREAPHRLVKAEGLESALAISEKVADLDLSGGSHTQLWQRLSGMPQLKRLSLRRGSVDDFAGVAALGTLRRLDLAEMRLTALPSAVTELTNLEQLYLSDNAITGVVSEIGEMRGLTYLNLDRNQLGTLPSEIGRLEGLRWLRLNSNRLQELPEAVGNCRRLQRLYLRDNRLTKLPDSLGECTLLEDLALSGNLIREFPPVITKLPKLRNLDLRDNPLESLPLEEMRGMKELRMLTLTGCKVEEDMRAALREALPRCIITF